MDSLSNNRIPYKIWKDFKIPETGNESYFQKAFSYKAKKDDIFLVSYPKCGTTWAQHIIYLIFNKGKPAENVSDIVATVPFPEQDDFPGKDMPIIAMKYHLPPELMPCSKEAKYLIVTRNPLDACVSYYHFLKNLPSYSIENFHTFCEAFLAGELPYGDYFDHLLSWYHRKDDSNVLLLTYEYLKASHYEAVKEIALFLGKDDVANDERILKDIVFYSSFEFMKPFIEGGDFMKTYLRVTNTVGIQDNLKTITQLNLGGLDNDKQPRMIRKGCVGDWKNYFSADQEKRIKTKFVQRTIGTNAHELWPDIFGEK